MNRAFRLPIFLGIFTVMNFAFVPLMSLYGLRVCPILHVAGFWFGCAYVGTYILAVSLGNALMVWALSKKARRQPFVENQIFIYLGTYLVATLVALVILQFLMHINHLSGSSRAPEILGFASLLLAITQAYGLDWALVRPEASISSQKPVTFQSLWVRHSLRTLVPVMTALGVLIHFQISQAEDFNKGRVADLVSHDQMIYQTSYLVVFMMAWLAITFVFHFLSEWDYAQRIQKHLARLGEADTKYRSPTAGAWGLWAKILFQLNEFSTVSEERGRLLKSFSKFVSLGVAKQAANFELTQTTGITQDTTILMSDIRDFTGLSEKLDPNQTVSLLNQYFGAMLDVMVQHQISVDKFIGDGILAYVETSVQKDDNAVEENALAVNASLKMLTRLKTLNASFAEQGLPSLQIGIGIYRGPVIIGLLGSEHKLQHTIIGDPVNRTARIEGLCKELGMSLLVSDQVWQSLPSAEQAQFEFLGSHVVKGLNEALVVYGARG